MNDNKYLIKGKFTKTGLLQQIHDQDFNLSLTSSKTLILQDKPNHSIMQLNQELNIVFTHAQRLRTSDHYFLTKQYEPLNELTNYEGTLNTDKKINIKLPRLSRWIITELDPEVLENTKMIKVLYELGINNYNSFDKMSLRLHMLQNLLWTKELVTTKKILILYQSSYTSKTNEYNLESDKKFLQGPIKLANLILEGSENSIARDIELLNNLIIRAENTDIQGILSIGEDDIID